MNLFERYLTVWVGLAIIVGIGLGQLLPAAFTALASMEVAKGNLDLLDRLPKGPLYQEDGQILINETGVRIA